MSVPLPALSHTRFSFFGSLSASKADLIGPHSHFGHDKSLSILPYRELENPPLLFFAGDGM